MNRLQAQAILANIDIIRHFAEGGDIGHRLIDCHGTQLYITPAKGIGLSGMSPGKHCLYVKVKPRFRWDENLKTYVRAPRYWPEKIKESEIIE